MKDYWKKRFKKLEKAQHNTAVKKSKEIQEHFERSLAIMERDLQLWYARLVVNNEVSMADARQMLSDRELKEFRWSLEEYIKHGKDNDDGKWTKELENASAKTHIERIEALKIQIQAEADKLYNNYDKEIEKYIQDMYIGEYYHTAFEIQKGIGVGTTFRKLDERMIQKVIHNPWAADERTFSDRIWTDHAKLVNTLHNEITKMVITGDGPDNAVERVQKAMGTSKRNATRIVITESAAFSMQARNECMAELGVKEFEVVETLDSHTCPTCQDMDGRHFPMKEHNIGVTAPPFHPGCRGCTCPYFNDEFTEEEKRAARDIDGKTYYVPSDMTYREWEKAFVDGDVSETEKSVVNISVHDIMKLSDEEWGAIMRYKSFDSYMINDALRNTDDITKLSGEQQKNIELIDKALSKIPTYNGDLVRTVNFSNWPDAEEKIKKFIEEFTKGSKIRIPQYWSTSSKDGHDDTAEIQIFIENAEKGHDIRTVGLDENEVLYERDSEFIVLEKVFVDGKWYILIKEI